VRKKSFYLLPNVFTTGALFAGFYSIVQAMNGHYDHAAIAIFVALIMDGLDGRVARLTQTQSAFGGEYDSLSDMVSFGVAPALVIYVWALQPLGRLGWVAAFIYCACAAIRLARFNVKLDIDNKKYFLACHHRQQRHSWPASFGFHLITVLVVMTFFSGFSLCNGLHCY
jgi:CDP-diacylglycerol--serine O-phosphatidyltransferase